MPEWSKKKNWHPALLRECSGVRSTLAPSIISSPWHDCITKRPARGPSGNPLREFSSAAPRWMTASCTPSQRYFPVLQSLGRWHHASTILEDSFTHSARLARSTLTVPLDGSLPISSRTSDRRTFHALAAVHGLRRHQKPTRRTGWVIGHLQAEWRSFGCRSTRRGEARPAYPASTIGQSKLRLRRRPKFSRATQAQQRRYAAAGARQAYRRRGNEQVHGRRKRLPLTSCLDIRSSGSGSEYAYCCSTTMVMALPWKRSE